MVNAPNWLNKEIKNSDGTVSIYCPLDPYAMPIDQFAKNNGVTIDPKPIDVEPDDFNHGLPVYKITGDRKLLVKLVRDEILPHTLEG